MSRRMREAMSSNKSFTLVIPSYWGRRRDEPFHPEDAVYDHPTPVDTEGTLGRALESICRLRYPHFRVAVLGAATHPSLEAEVETRLGAVIAPFRDRYPLALFTHRQERELRERVARGPKGELAEMISLRGYSNIRNLCLVVACLSNADAVVLFDDDEVYEDSQYLEKVAENIGGVHEGLFVGGLAGYYVNRDGGYRLPPNAEPALAEWPAVEYMNRAFEIIESPERLQPTSWVFGGNMVVHRELYMKVAFDPHVPRGEDIDYLINSAFFGYRFFLDNELRIRHLPPPKTASLWRRFREDLDRFLYTREKLRSQEPVEGCRRVEVEELEPYPGRFLRDDLEELVYRTCVLMGMDYLSRDDREGYRESVANLMRSKDLSRFPPSPFRWYLGWRKRWEELMDFLASDRGSREFMEGLFDARRRR